MVDGSRRVAFFHFATLLDPRGPHGGAETAVIATARALAARGHRVTVLGRLREDVVDEGVAYRTAGAPGGFDIAGGLARLTDGCDLLVSTMHGAVLAASRDRRDVRRRVLWPQVMAFDAIGLAAPALGDVADRIVAVSQAQAAALVAATVPAAMIDVVPYGLDQRLFAPGDAAERAPGRIAFVGALVPDKGIDRLLRAMPAVSRLVPGAHLVVCGSAGLWERAPFLDEGAIRRQVPGVDFRGALAKPALAALLRTAVLGVVPTPPERWCESFGMVSIEMQACGIPVIVTRSGGLVETVRDGETGWIVGGADPGTLGASIVTALRDPGRLGKMGVLASAWTRARFSWERTAAAFERLMPAQPRAYEVADDARPGGEAPPRVASPHASSSTRGEAGADAPATPRVATAPALALLSTWRQPCGLARYAEQLVAALPSVRMHVLAEAVETPLAPDGTAAVSVERCWRRGTRLDGVAERVAALGVPLLHVSHHGALFGDALSTCLRAVEARGIRTVVTLHAPNQRDPEIAAIGAVADAVVVHGDGPRLEVIANGVAPERVYVVPHGIRPVASGDATALRRDMGLASDERLVASVGFLQPHKGFHEVIAALPALRARHRVQYLVLGGAQPGDPSAARYRAQCLAEAERLGVAAAVTITDGYLPDATVAAYLRAADVIVLPYRTTWWEASGAAREAIASGRPVATSDALAFHDLGPAVFRTSGTFHLAAAIDAVLTEPALAAELVRQGARLAEQDAWPRVAARHEALWAGLLATARRPDAGGTRTLPPPVAAAPRRGTAPRRVACLLRPGARETGGGDWVQADAIARHADRAAWDVACPDGGPCPDGTALAHLFNFATYGVTEAHARAVRARGIPYVVSALYEDWPAFKVASETRLQQYRVRLGLPATLDLEAYARTQAREQTAMLAAARMVAAGARAVIATGPGEAARLGRDVPGAHVREVPVAVPARAGGDVDAFAARYGTRDFVLCVGRLEPRKNQLALLEALVDDPVDVVLATGGTAYRADYLETCQRFRRRGRTLYLPALSDAELAAAYRAARVHVLPSWFELPGLVTLEALALGCPVVATDRGTVRDYLGDGVPYGAADDPAALRRAIEAAAGWSYAAAMARARACTTAASVRAWMAVYAAACTAAMEGAA